MKKNFDNDYNTILKFLHPESSVCALYPKDTSLLKAMGEESCSFFSSHCIPNFFLYGQKVGFNTGSLDYELGSLMIRRQTFHNVARRRGLGAVLTKMRRFHTPYGKRCTALLSVTPTQAAFERSFSNHGYLHNNTLSVKSAPPCVPPVSRTPSFADPCMG